MRRHDVQVGVWVADKPPMTDRLKAIGVLGSTYGSFEREVENALTGIPAEPIVSISYSTSRILSVWLQHHALIVVREP